MFALKMRSQTLEKTKVSISLNNARVIDFFKAIEAQTDYSFSYNNTVKNNGTLLSYKGEMSVRQVLEKLSLEARLGFKRINSNISVKVLQKKEHKIIISEPITKKISGHITDVNGQPLPGVNISIKGASIGATTDFNGNFNLEIPEDTQVLVVSYIGFKTQEIAIGTRSYFQIQMKEDATSLQQVVVMGQRRSNLNAIASKRNSVVVVDAISSDEAGSLPDDNVGDVLRRIPGVSQKDDQGETRFVSVRGLNPDYNFFSVNGSRIAVPDRNGRRVFLDVLPSSLSKELQTVKTFSADLDAGGVGAHINLVPRSAYDYKGKYYFKIYGRGGFYENNNGPQNIGPSAKSDMIFAWKPDRANKFGVIVAADYYKRVSYTDHLENSSRINFYRASDNVELTPTFTTEGRQLEGDGQFYDFNDPAVFGAPDGINRYVYLNNRERIGVSTVLDYKLNGSTKFKFMQFYNEGTDDEARYGNRFISDQNRVFATQTSGFIDFEHRLETAAFDFSRQVWGTQFQYDQRIAKGLLKVKGNYSGSKFFNDENFFRFTSTDTGSGNALRETYHYDLANRNALLTPLDLAAYNNLSNYVLRGFANFQELRNLREDIYEGQIDFENNINQNGFGYKVGTKFRTIDRDYNEDQLRWLPIDQNNFVATDFIADAYTPELLGVSNQNDMFIIDKDKAIEGLLNTRGDAARFTLEDRIPRSNERDYGMTENVLAGYAMFSHKGEKHYVNAGLRVENTDFTGRGRGQVEGDNTVWEDVTNSGQYFKWLPAVHSYYNLKENLKIRASYSKSLGRPDFISFAPRGESLTISEADGQDEIRGQRGNPDLKPRESNNFDLSLEYYLDKNKGLVALGLFHKSIKNEFFRLTESTIARLDGQTLPAYISQFSNLDRNVNLTGIEFNIIKDLDFLPGVLNGFGVSFNALYMFNPKVYVPNTSGVDDDLDGKNDLLPYTKLSGLLEQSNEVFNASLYYQKGKISGRLAYHYSGDFLDTIDTSNPERNRRQLGREIVDFKFKYQLNKNVNLYLLSQNLTDSGRRIDYDIPNTSGYAQLVKRDYGRTFFLGLSYKIRN